jgi:hypothetical protein
MAESPNAAIQFFFANGAPKLFPAKTTEKRRPERTLAYSANALSYQLVRSTIARRERAAWGSNIDETLPAECAERGRLVCSICLSLLVRAELVEL